MITHSVPKGSTGVHFTFDNPHGLKISNAKGALLKDGKVIMQTTTMQKITGNFFFLPISTALQPGNYIVVASGNRGLERVSARIALKINRQKK